MSLEHFKNKSVEFHHESILRCLGRSATTAGEKLIIVNHLDMVITKAVERGKQEMLAAIQAKYQTTSGE